MSAILRRIAPVLMLATALSGPVVTMAVMAHVGLEHLVEPGHGHHHAEEHDAGHDAEPVHGHSHELTRGPAFGPARVGAHGSSAPAALPAAERSPLHVAPGRSPGSEASRQLRAGPPPSRRSPILLI